VLPFEQSPWPPDHRLSRTFYFGKAEADPHQDRSVIDLTIDYLRNKPRQPFCLHIGTSLPHAPYHVEEPYFSMYDRESVRDPIPPDFENKPEFMEKIYDEYRLADLTPADYREFRATYCGMVTKLDHQVGRVIAALKEQGLYDDSLVIFLSDHADFVGDYGLVEKWPSSLQDNLLHVPLIVKYPGSLQAGEQVTTLTQSIDLFATVLEQAGIDTPYTHFSRSLTPLAENGSGREAVFAVGGYDLREPQAFEERMPSPEDSMIGHYYYKIRLQNDDPSTVARSAMIRTKTWKLIIRSTGKEELYHLENDPRETDNLIDDPDYEPIQRELRDKLLHWFLQTSDNPDWQRTRSF
jgi:choline-sulfatase